MNIEKRTKEIRESIKSCSREGYLKSELLPEMLDLQRELVELTFNKEHADLSNLKLWDVENHFEKLSEDNGNAALPELLRFKEECKEVCNLIRAEISGKWGEEKVFSYIEGIQEPHILLKNVSLNLNGIRTEIDAIVLTKMGAFIVEVKNTKKNVFIDDNGDYYRVGDYSRLDSNIGEKLQIRKDLLHTVLESAGLPKVDIHSLVVFTNNRIEVKNRNNDITTCFLAQLPYTIEEWGGSESFTDADLLKAAAAIEGSRSNERFPLDFDAEQFKNSFAVLMATLEAISEKKETIEDEIPEVIIETGAKQSKWRTVFHTVFSAKNLRIACNVAALVTTVITTAAKLKNDY